MEKNNSISDAVRNLIDMGIGDSHFVKEVKIYNSNSLVVRIEDCVHTVKILSVKNGCIMKSNLDYVLQGSQANSYVIADAIAAALGCNITVISKCITYDEVQEYQEPELIYDILDKNCVSFVYLDSDDVLNVVHNDSEKEVEELMDYLDSTEFCDHSKTFKYKAKSLKEFMIEALMEKGVYRTDLDKKDMLDVQDYFKQSKAF